jgi:hypothetical protein
VSKFLLNLLERISKALVNLKNLIFNPKILLPIHSSLSAWLALPDDLAFGPASPAVLPSLQAEAFLTGPSSPCVDGVPVEIRFPFWFAPSELVTFSLCQVDPGCQLCLPPHAGRPRLRRCQIPLRSATSCRPASCLEWLPRALTHPAIKTPSLTPLNLTVFNGIEDINATVTPPATPPRCSPTPIKGEHHPQTSPHLFPSLPCPGEQPIEFPVSPSPCCALPASSDEP